MYRTILKIILASIFLLQQNVFASPADGGVSEVQIASAIRFLYESRLSELKPINQGHWLLRLYRISGDRRYLDGLRRYGDWLVQEFERFTLGVKDGDARAKEVQRLLGPVPPASHAKYVKRRAVLEQVPDYLYRHQLLYLLFMLQSLGLEPRAASQYHEAILFLRDFDFQPYLTKSELLQYNAAETANDVHYLKALGIDADEEGFLRAFQRAHAETERSGDAVLFENKIYGLTHWIIAATGYYQRKADPDQFSWVLDYFEEHADEIFKRSKPDVVAETGLCFLLAGRPDSFFVAKAREIIRDSWDPATGLIPSVKGSSDLNQSEHRNVLAYMLLKGFDRLYPGPNLTDPDFTGMKNLKKRIHDFR